MNVLCACFWSQGRQLHIVSGNSLSLSLCLHFCIICLFLSARAISSIAMSELGEERAEYFPSQNVTSSPDRLQGATRRRRRRCGPAMILGGRTIRFGRSKKLSDALKRSRHARRGPFNESCHKTMTTDEFVHSLLFAQSHSAD